MPLCIATCIFVFGDIHYSIHNLYPHISALAESIAIETEL